MGMNLSESPLAVALREPFKAVDRPFGYPLNFYGLVDDHDLTDLGRATLAALSLPDAGEPSVMVYSSAQRNAKWEFGHRDDSGTPVVFSVHLDEWWDWSGVLHQRITVSGNVDTVPLLMASALIAAHALAEQWRAEREATV